MGPSTSTANKKLLVVPLRVIHCFIFGEHKDKMYIYISNVYKNFHGQDIMLGYCWAEHSGILGLESHRFPTGELQTWALISGCSGRQRVWTALCVCVGLRVCVCARFGGGQLQAWLLEAWRQVFDVEISSQVVY